MLGEKIRKIGFWSLDFVKGARIRAHYKDIKNIIESPSDSEDPTEEYLFNLLDHAVETSQYYCRYKGYKSLEDFPIIDKNMIKANEDKIMSEKYKGKKLHAMSTSGSTGIPFTILQDRNKRKRVQAEIIYFGEICGYNLGDRNACFRIWTGKKNRLSHWKQNLVPVDISNLDRENLERIRIRLKQKDKIKCILSYAKSLQILSRYLVERGDTPNMFHVELVISSSQALDDLTRENLKKVFGCNVVSRYSNQENGVLAQEPINSDYFLINRANYHMEFLKVDSEEVAELGELARVVITDLFNYATPIIRYDTGDLATLQAHGRYGRVIKQVEGRRSDFLFNTKGELVNPGIVNVNMSSFDKVNQYQFIQNGEKDYVLKLNVLKGLYEDEDIISMLKSGLGKDANITIEHVEGIPHLASGKFRSTVQNYKKDVLSNR
ncbi:MAG: phenylacetate--CoA ligase family protein [Tissierellia bacterium]|nr:phenylacetate--CoA ligase family protein [Tissierellia bacterium]